MATSSTDSTEKYQGTGPSTDKGVFLVIGLVVAVILLMAGVTQGHNTVNEGTDPPPGAYSSTLVTNSSGN